MIFYIYRLSPPYLFTSPNLEFPLDFPNSISFVSNLLLHLPPLTYISPFLSFSLFLSPLLSVFCLTSILFLCFFFSFQSLASFPFVLFIFVSFPLQVCFFLPFHSPFLSPFSHLHIYFYSSPFDFSLPCLLPYLYPIPSPPWLRPSFAFPFLSSFLSTLSYMSLYTMILPLCNSLFSSLSPYLCSLSISSIFTFLTWIIPSFPSPFLFPFSWLLISFYSIPFNLPLPYLSPYMSPLSISLTFKSLTWILPSLLLSHSPTAGRCRLPRVCRPVVKTPAVYTSASLLKDTSRGSVCRGRIFNLPRLGMRRAAGKQGGKERWK